MAHIDFSPRVSPPNGDETVLTNARVVTADEVVLGTVVLRDGVIADLDGGRTAVPAAVDLEGDYLIPGIIDIHTDNLEKHVTPRPGVAWPMTAAIIAHDAQVIAAGITTVFDALAVGAIATDSPRNRILGEAIEGLERVSRRGLLRAEHLLHLRCEVAVPDVVGLFAAHAGHPLVRLVSVMDHTPGQRQWRDVEKFFAFNQRRLDREELARLIEKRKLDQEAHATPNRQRIVALCKERGLALASHDDTTLEHVAEALADGIDISEFPTTLEAARLAHDNGMATVAGAPNMVRGGSHSGNVSAQELAAEGLLDALTSDYVPAAMLHAAFLLHERIGIALPAAVATVTGHPARMLRLDDRGEIAVGKRADVVRVSHEDIPVALAVWRQGVRMV